MSLVALRPDAAESLGERVRRLQAEALSISDAAARAALTTAANLCEQLADLQTMNLLPEGERDAYKKLAAEIDSRCESICAIRAKRR